MRAFTAKYTDLMRHLTVNTGANVTDLITASNIHDTLFIERDNGLQLPGWASDGVMTALSEISDYTFYCDYSTRLVQRFRAGLFLKDLRHRLHYAIDSKYKATAIEWTEFPELKKLYIYSTVC